LKRQLSVPEIRKGLSEKAVRSGGAYLQGDMGRRDNPLYRQDLAKIGRGQLPFQGLTKPLRPAPIISDFLGSATVPVAPVGVSPTERCAADNFTRSAAFRAYR
jgi:hypothetical protein